MIRIETDGRVGSLTIDRPEKRNALTADALTALETGIERLETPVVRLRGAGPAFCAGADLEAVAALDGERAAEFARRGQRVANAIEGSSSVVVAVV
ncbi:enoyl-CoA hydratase/isomerase family protein, partial [Halococcus hamelinensis]